MGTALGKLTVVIWMEGFGKNSHTWRLGKEKVEIWNNLKFVEEGISNIYES